MKLKTKLFSIFIPVYLIPLMITGIIVFYETHIYPGQGLPFFVKAILHFISMGVALGAGYFVTEKLISPLKEITSSMDKIAHGKLNERINISTDDEFQDLADTFNDMTKSLQKHTQTLANSLRELKDETDRANAATEILAQSAQYMDCATNESQNVINDLVEKKDFSLRFDNPELTRNCWEINNCTKTSCPAYNNPNKRCWHIAGTFCGGEAEGDFAKKMGDCRKCDVYKKATPNRLTELGEAFNHLINFLEVEKKRNRELLEAKTNEKRPDNEGQTAKALNDFIENTSK